MFAIELSIYINVMCQQINKFLLSFVTQNVTTKLKSIQKLTELDEITHSCRILF